MSNFKSLLIFITLIFVAAQAAGQGIGNRFGNLSGVGSATSTENFPRKIKKDTIISVIPDSLRSAENDLETTVEYSASDSTIMDVDGQTVFLYGNAVVNYGEIKLKADYIRLNWGESEVFAHGLVDSTGQNGIKVRGKPIFSQGADNYNTDTIRYNFKTRKAIIKNIVTQQGEGIVQGEKVKKDPIDNLYLANAKYSTCDLQDPHFHIASKKIILVNKKSIISGPFNFVLAGIPIPVGLPFGFFPVPKKKEIGTSGFVMGNYGEEPNNRGFYLRDFGYYHAFNEYIGAKLLAQVYSRGSWGLGLQSNYTVKYKVNGNVNLQFNYNKPGEEFSTTTPSKDFNITWSHAPQSRRPDRSFSANVNLVSNSFNQNNRRLDEVDNYTNNTFGSSIQYSRNFGKLVRTNSGFNVNQNVSTKIFTGSLNYNIGLNQFNPFVPEKKQVGKWYESFRVGLNVTGGYSVNNSVTNRSTSYTDYNIAGVLNSPITSDQEREKTRLENLLLQRNLTDAERAQYQEQLKELTNPVLSLADALANNGIFNNSYTVPISLPNLKLARYINLTPNISYRGDMYTKELKYGFLNPTNGVETYTKSNGKVVRATLDPNADSIATTYASNGDLDLILNPNSGGVVVIDTLNKLAFGQNFSFGAGLNTRMYGNFRFGKKSKIQAIRHTIAPSLSFNYTPDGARKTGYATRALVRQDSLTSTYKYLSRFINSSGSVSSASGSIGLSISNQLEAKIRNKSDTAETEFTKISLLDNFSLSTNYNPFADVSLGEFAFSNVALSANTSILKGLISMNMSGTLDPYAYQIDNVIASNKAGTRLPGVFKWNKNAYTGSGGKYLSNAYMALNTRLSPKVFDKTKGKAENNDSEDEAQNAMERFINANPLAFVDFSIPWTLNINYAFSFNKQGLAEARTTQTLQFQGDFSLTPKWKFTYSTGWDFQYKAVTLTNVGIIRDLHCWDMSFNWTPIAGNSARASNYSFDLRVKSALLKDLKVSRRRMYYDRGGF